MKKKILTFALIAGAIAAILSPRPARAVAAIPGLADVEQVVVTPVTILESTDLYCGGDTILYHFDYLQLMTVHGFGRVWVPVDFAYSNDSKKEAGFVEECQEGDTTYYIYELGSCSC